MEENVKMILRERFQNRLRELRAAKGVPQATAAIEAGIVRSRYQSYEDGTNSPGLVALYRLADYFDVSIDYLVGRTDEPLAWGFRRAKDC